MGPASPCSEAPRSRGRVVCLSCVLQWLSLSQKKLTFPVRLWGWNWHVIGVSEAAGWSALGSSRAHKVARGLRPPRCPCARHSHPRCPSPCNFRISVYVESDGVRFLLLAACARCTPCVRCLSGESRGPAGTAPRASAAAFAWMVLRGLSHPGACPCALVRRACVCSCPRRHSGAVAVQTAWPVRGNRSPARAVADSSKGLVDPGFPRFLSVETLFLCL